MKKLALRRISSGSSLPKAKRRWLRRSLRFDLGLLAFVALLLFMVNQGYLRKQGTVRASNPVPATKLTPPQHSDALAKADPAGAAPMIPVSFRPLNFALLRGGFTSVDEFFERVNEDPALHAFYGDCVDRDASMHALPEDVMVFSTFRKGNQIKWAQKPLLVHKGEYVMTFCGKTVLARCGNLVSMAAMQPSEDVPPAVLETPVDALEPPLSLASVPASDGVAPVPAAAVPFATVHPGRFFFVPPFWVPQGGSHTAPLTVVAPPPPTPPPPTHMTGDEFSGNQALITLLFGFLAIGLVKLLTQ
jgi:hypothetical protein